MGLGLIGLMALSLWTPEEDVTPRFFVDVGYQFLWGGIESPKEIRELGEASDQTVKLGGVSIGASWLLSERLRLGGRLGWRESDFASREAGDWQRESWRESYHQLVGSFTYFNDDAFFLMAQIDAGIELYGARCHVESTGYEIYRKAGRDFHVRPVVHLGVGFSFPFEQWRFEPSFIFEWKERPLRGVGVSFLRGFSFL